MASRMCNCMGPHNGDPACPCAMRAEWMAKADWRGAWIDPNTVRFEIKPDTRDADWIARELGDVKYRTAGELLPWPEADPYPSRVPVESLGRES